MRKTESQKIALCGVLSALSVVVLLVGNVLQIGTYAAPMLASFLLIPVLEDYGKKYALLLYAVVSLLSLFLVPDKELVLFYVLVLGYYPVLRVRLNNIRRGVLRWMAKFGCFNAAVVVMYALLIVVLTMAFLATSIVTAARINAGVRETDTSLHYDGSAAPVQGTLTITRQGGTGTGSAVRKSVSVYETEGGYRYYVYQE